MFPVRDNIPSAQPPYVNFALMGMNVMAYVWEVSWGHQLPQIVQTIGFVPGRFLSLLSHDPLGHVPELLAPLFASMFLHGGWLHLLLNMWFLWVFGDNVEDILGHGRYLFFYLASGVGASLIYVAFAPASMIPLVGASGAIAGVMGAYWSMFPGARVVTLIPILIIPTFWELPAFVFIGIWFALQLAQGAYSTLSHTAGQGGVAWWAHVGGFAVGLVLVRLMEPQRARRLLRRRH
jgi:membrane associated rhomboid family serine protease